MSSRIYCHVFDRKRLQVPQQQWSRMPSRTCSPVLGRVRMSVLGAMQDSGTKGSGHCRPLRFQRRDADQSQEAALSWSLRPAVSHSTPGVVNTCHPGLAALSWMGSNCSYHGSHMPSMTWSCSIQDMTAHRRVVNSGPHMPSTTCGPGLHGTRLPITE